MRYDIFFDDNAELEYIAAAKWYEQRRSKLGLEFLDAVDATLRHVASFPQTGLHVPHTDPDLAIRQLPVKRFPFHVFYVVLPRGVKILAIAHERRRPEYWKGRIK